MALDADQAKKRVKELLSSSASTRAAYEAYCGLCIAYAYGAQWTASAPTPRGGHQAMQLRTIIDADRSDVRVTLNLIRARISKLHSRLSPEDIRTRVEPASRSNNDQVASLVANERMRLAKREIRAVRQVEKAGLWRLVLGSAVLRRHLWRGMPVVARDTAGRPLIGQDGQPQKLPTTGYAWGLGAPYEFVRDPAAYDLDFDGEDCIVHEKPRTLSWLTRHFGVHREDLGEKTSTMGQLMEFQQFLYKGTGNSCDLSTRTDSKEPAVMVGDAWFRDDDADRERRWPQWGMYYRNQGGATSEDREVRWLPMKGDKPLFGDNPYHQLPLHHLYYEPEVGCPWAKGVPFLLIQPQDMGNLGWTGMMRRFLAHGSPKYVFLEDSVKEPHRVLGPDMWMPIPITGRGSVNDVRRMDPPAMDPSMMAILQGLPTWFDWLLNMAPVQFGMSAGKHPEAGKAIITRKDEADTPLNHISRRDEWAINEALTGTLFDIVRHEPTEVLAQTLSHEFTHDQILTLKEQDIERSVVGVAVVPDSLRPRTREEVRQDTATDLQLKLLDPVTARRNMFITEGIRTDEKECRAIELQTQEIATILDGREPPVLQDQDHDAHIWRIALEVESARAQGYSDEQLDGLMAHSREHEARKLIRAQVAAGEQAALQNATGEEAAMQDGLPPEDEMQPDEQMGLEGPDQLQGGELPQPLGGAEAPMAEPAEAVA